MVIVVFDLRPMQAKTSSYSHIKFVLLWESGHLNPAPSCLHSQQILTLEGTVSTPAACGSCVSRHTQANTHVR